MATTERAYKGEKITVSYNVRRCMHAAECVSSGLRNVFDNSKKPWVKADGAQPEKIIDVVERCPSGALHYLSHDGPQEIPETNTVRPQPHGALYVRGDLKLELPTGEALQETRLALCRCGQSENEPFCDHSHARVQFADAGQLGKTALTPEIINTEEALEVKPSPNGPIIIRGAFALRSTDNSNILYGTTAALCRCGQSNNKPFCDGSHRKVGFSAE